MSKYPGKDNVIARMVLIHMVVAATAFLMSFPPALIQELSKHSGAAPGTHAAIPLFQITIGSVTNWCVFPKKIIVLVSTIKLFIYSSLLLHLLLFHITVS